jgi:pyruvate dehydrogenase E2 component (dihydrolipoamide acetyltransferase)
MDFLLPKLSATMETAVIGKWFKKAGDVVKSGEALVELETDKATLEVESPVDGTLAEIVAETGAELEIGAVLARIEAKGESGKAFAASATASAASDRAVAPSSTAAVAASEAAPVTRTASARAAAGAAPSRIFSSPLARRLAGLHGVELSELTGSGPHGRIRKRDVMAAVKPGETQRPSATARSAVEQGQAAGVRGAKTVGGKAALLSPMRAGIAASVTLSRQTIPSFVLDRWVDTGAIGRARGLLGPEIEQQSGVKLTFTDFLLQAIADSLGQAPQLLDRYVEENGKPARIPGTSIDIGLVVAVTGGVMIPVIRDLAGKSLAAIAAERQAAVQRARSGRLSQADYRPAISLSNIGKSGADRFEAIIGPGQTGILAVGREHEKVVPRAGAIAISKGVNVTLAADHRLIDGLTGADFLGVLADRMERGPWAAG